MREKDYYGAIKGFCLKWNLPEVWNSDRITGANLIYEVIKVINAMILEQKEVKEMIEEFIRMFDEDLDETVREVLIEWKDSGVLENVINEALFNQKLDKTVFEDFEENVNKNLEHVNDLFINVKEYGAVGDGVTDDTDAIQTALSDPNNLRIFFPEGDYLVGGNVQSEHILSLGIRNKEIFGAGQYKTKIMSNRKTDTLLLLNNLVDTITIKNIDLDSNYLTDYSLNTLNYSPYLRLEKSTFQKAIKTAVRVQTWMSNIIECFFIKSNIGLNICGEGENISTSNNVTSSYANDNVEYGFYFGGIDNRSVVVYSSFNNLACDNILEGIAYGGRMFSCTFNSCGAEKCNSFIKTQLNRAIVLNACFILNSGDANSNIIDIGGGSTTIINGFYFQNTLFRKKVVLRTSLYGYENIVINESEIKRSDVEQIGTNFSFGENAIFMPIYDTVKIKDEVDVYDVTYGYNRDLFQGGVDYFKYTQTYNVSVDCISIPLLKIRKIHPYFFNDDSSINGAFKITIKNYGTLTTDIYLVGKSLNDSNQIKIGDSLELLSVSKVDENIVFTFNKSVKFIYMKVEKIV